MKVFVAGAASVLCRALIPQLVARGHDVVGMTRSAPKQDLVRDRARGLDLRLVRRPRLVRQPYAAAEVKERELKQQRRARRRRQRTKS